MPRKAPPSLRVPALLLIIAAAAGILLFGLRDRVPEQTTLDPRAESRWMPPAPSDRWTCIVIHHSAGESGGADQFDRWHRKRGWDGLGYHFVVGNGTDTAEGQVEVGPRWTAQKHGAHCKSKNDYYNQHGIGICLVGNLDLHPPGARQRESLRRLVAFLSREFNIPPEQILTHGGVTGQTHCPGKHFDLQALRNSVRDAVASAGEP